MAREARIGCGKAVEVAGQVLLDLPLCLDDEAQAGAIAEAAGQPARCRRRLRTRAGSAGSGARPVRPGAGASTPGGRLLRGPPVRSARATRVRARRAPAPHTSPGRRPRRHGSRASTRRPAGARRAQGRRRRFSAAGTGRARPSAAPVDGFQRPIDRREQAIGWRQGPRIGGNRSGQLPSTSSFTARCSQTTATGFLAGKSWQAVEAVWCNTATSAEEVGLNGFATEAGVPIGTPVQPRR